MQHMKLDPNLFGQNFTPTESTLGNWCANLTVMSGRKTVIFTNEKTLYSFTATGVTKNNSQRVVGALFIGIWTTLLKEKIMEQQTTTKPFLKAFAFAFIFTATTLILIFSNIQREISSETAGEICGHYLAMFFMAATINGFIIRKSPKVWSLAKIGTTTFLLSIFVGALAGAGNLKDSKVNIEAFKKGVEKGIDRKPQFEISTKTLLKRYFKMKVDQHSDTLATARNIEKESLELGMKFFSIIFEEMSIEEREEVEKIQEQAFFSLPEKDQDDYARLVENPNNLNSQYVKKVAKYDEKAFLSLPKENLQKYNEIIRSVVNRLLNKENNSKH